MAVVPDTAPGSPNSELWTVATTADGLVGFIDGAEAPHAAVSVALTTPMIAAKIILCMPSGVAKETPRSIRCLLPCNQALGEMPTANMGASGTIKVSVLP